ncbi:MAG: hypothetical protein B7Z16_13280 [Algoriphagus sp. 32-45-6]|nr:MAG: hypothetical protein B7Z16_13280 [Algoriphagus sp. 32-45-6]
MKKQQIALFLSFCWAIGLVAVFSFPPTQKSQSRVQENTVVQELSSPHFHLRTSSAGSTSVPGFEVDWSLFSRLNSDWVPSSILPFTRYFAPTFFQKSRGLLNHFQFFIQYFYSW